MLGRKILHCVQDDTGQDDTDGGRSFTAFRMTRGRMTQGVQEDTEGGLYGQFVVEKEGRNV